MNRITTPFVVAAAALASLTLSAEDFRPLMQVTQSTWPEKQHIGVVCDYRASKDQVQALAMATGKASLVLNRKGMAEIAVYTAK